MFKSKLALLSLLVAIPFSALAFSPSKSELTQFPWHDLALAQKQNIQPQLAKLTGATGSVVGYKIPANQGTLNISVKSAVVENKSVFVPNVLVLDSQFTPSLTYPASQFKFVEERGLSGAHYQAELSLTPTANQDFIYVLVYTTDKELQGSTTMTHPAKLLAKAKGNHPPAIADIQVAHANQGNVSVEVEGLQSTQFIGLNGGALFESKKAQPQQVGAKAEATQPAPKKVTQPVEQSTEDYFNQAVLKALKANDVNKAMNLVNEAEQLGLKQPRQIFIKHISVQQ